MIPSSPIDLLISLRLEIVDVNPTKGKWTFNNDSLLLDPPGARFALLLLLGGLSSSVSKLDVSSGPETVGVNGGRTFRRFSQSIPN